LPSIPTFFTLFIHDFLFKPYNVIIGIKQEVVSFGEYPQVGKDFFPEPEKKPFNRKLREFEGSGNGNRKSD